MQVSVFFNLLYIELIPFFRILKRRLIDHVCWIGSRTLVFVFLLPVIGAPIGYVGIFFAGTFLVGSLFEGMGTIVHVVSDLEEFGTMNFELLLPLSQRLIYLKLVLSHAVRALVTSLMLLVLAKAFMWNAFDLSGISFCKTAIALVLTNIFSGFFVLFCATHIFEVSDTSFVWRNWIYPLLILGGLLFPWRAINAFSPFIAKIFLLNPLIHANEAVRAALLGQLGYRPFWISGVSLIMFSIFFGVFGFVAFKKRLDVL